MYRNALLQNVIFYKNFTKWSGRAVFSTQVDIDLKFIDNKITSRGEDGGKDDESYENAIPFEKVPGPSKLKLLTSFMPGGKYYKKNLTEVFALARKEYGDLLYFPGIFGKRDTLLAFNPVDFQKVFRTDGQWPHRTGFDIIDYYRKEIRSEFYKTTYGFSTEQGKSWGRIRSIVNPIMVHPQAMKVYIPSVDRIANEFIQRIRNIRDPRTNEVPSTFNDEIQYLAMESVVLVAMDTSLGLLSGLPRSEDAKNFVRSTTDFFTLLYELDIKPSLWKILATPKFKKMIATQDTIFEICSKYIEKAKKRMNSENSENSDEKSVLEKLLHIDKDFATVMAVDLMLAGIDTTFSAFTACLFILAKHPEKQSLLRDELRAILPQKDTPLTKDNMRNLPYLRACIKEALRLNSVTTLNFRKTGQNVVLSGYQVPKGTNVSMVVHLIQREEVHFPRALEFLPERWLRNPLSKTECPSAKTTNPFVYLPFGFGPRMCIGKRFVELEIEVALAKIIRNFYVHHEYPDLIFKTTVLNYPTGDFRFKFVDLPE